MKQKAVVAIVGNPNSGKTSIFNNLTGARQHVGNYSGVTVEKKEGYRRYKDIEMQIVDLPGTYSLSAYSAEELITRNYILDEKPDVLVNIIDSSNLVRNLYLASQLMELGVPMVLAFNMSDEARARGYEFDIEKLSMSFGSSIVQTVGHKGTGMEELLDAIVATATANGSSNGGGQKKTISYTGSQSSNDLGYKKPVIDYGREIEEEIGQIEFFIKANNLVDEKVDSRWTAIKLLEGDKDIRTKVNSPEILNMADVGARQIEIMTGESPEASIAGRRYEFISAACQGAVRSTIEIHRTVSDRIDAIVTNRLLGIPVFMGLMFLVFNLTFTLGEPIMGGIETLFAGLGGIFENFWPKDSTSLLKSLIVDGIIGGVGGVVVFLPNILLLFMGIAILEDSGYMARAAFIMDRLMNSIGLHGKSFIPMLIGFGCSVPAIMATRTLENRRDRLATMLVIPLMSCGARLPIYALIIPAFFPPIWRAPMLWIIYVIGILLAVISAKILRSTILKGEAVPFVMEMPPYRMPTLKSIMIHTWERGWLYLKKAGTIILGISVLMWAMTTFPGLSEDRQAYFETKRSLIQEKNAEDAVPDNYISAIDNEEAQAALLYSMAGRIGLFMEPMLKPMGFDWKIGTALIGAFVAKEVFVVQMGIMYSVGKADEDSETLREELVKSYSPLTGFCIMLFCLISAPCMATIAVTRKESGSWKWALFQLGALTLLAYLLTVFTFQAGNLLGIGTSGG